MSDLDGVSRRRFLELAILTSGSLVIGTNQAHASDQPCPNGGLPCTFCRDLDVRPQGGTPARPGARYPDINPWRDWRDLRLVAPV